MTRVCREIIKYLMQIPDPTRRDVDIAKLEVAGRHNGQAFVSNSQLIQCLELDEEKKLLPLLRRKMSRTISGVTIIAAMTKPWPCPHNNAPCAFCPGGPSHGVPQSYTGHEPAAMRGIQNQYDPYTQVENRIEQLKAIGHSVDKVELIVMGGTFPSMNMNYQRDFIKGCLEAIVGAQAHSLEEAKKLAETSKIRNVGITVETRPDWAKRRQIDHLLSMGVTRVEIGVQNVYDDVYSLVRRGHTVKDVAEATQGLKDSGLKVLYHLMPGLPGATFQRDIEGFRRVFADTAFKPDMIKIYPCLVLRNTRTYQWWRKGRYVPYSTEDAVRLISEVKKNVPPWVRIMRVQRDIPASLIAAGVKKSNLRQLVLRRLELEGAHCRCIRCREAGHRWLHDEVKPDRDNIEVSIIRNEASGGIDLFVSAEDSANDVLIGYLRLRIPSMKAHRKEIASTQSSVIRELHVLGRLVPVGKHIAAAWQHKGYGAALLSEAERISIEDYDVQKILVMSGLGTKKYYMRFGYNYDGPYMSKRLRR